LVTAWFNGLEIKHLLEYFLVDNPAHPGEWFPRVAPAGTMDKESLATVSEKGAVREIKEWQAIMDHPRSLPVEVKGQLPIIPVDERAAEIRTIRVG
jgi:hypothetical protein